MSFPSVRRLLSHRCACVVHAAGARAGPCRVCTVQVVVPCCVFPERFAGRVAETGLKGKAQVGKGAPPVLLAPSLSSPF